MAFTEFYCDPVNGSNLHAGSTSSSSAAFTYPSGDWVQGSGVFTVASGNPLSDGVAVGDFASVYADGSATTGFVGRVTGRDATTITVSLTAKIGSAPSDSSGAHNRTLKIGGAWLGPNAAVGFPLTLLSGSLTNSNGDYPRVNMKNNATYSITANISIGGSGPVFIQGYTSTIGDLGRAIIDGGTSGASYVLITYGSGLPNWRWTDIILQNNGASGTAAGMNIGNAGATHHIYWRCKFANFRGQGVACAGTGGMFRECEFTACGAAGGGTARALQFTAAGGRAHRCYFHDTTGFGISIESGSTLMQVSNCIFDTCTSSGFLVGSNSSTAAFITNSDFYNNTASGIDVQSTGTGTLDVENCNFVKNGAYGVNFSGAGVWSGYITNCAFGSGTQVNALGQTSTSTKGVVISGSITLASGATPWVDPVTGNFTPILLAVKNVGRGNMPTGLVSTVSYPDIGAVQHLDSPGIINRPINVFMYED